MKLIAITGGIGSGKSVVASIVKIMGHQVYDCDSRAKALMTEDDALRKQLVEAFGQDTYLADGRLNREHLSKIAFTDKNVLTRLNAIVHPATANDINRWAGKLAKDGASVAFIETALLRTSGLNNLVDGVWHVTAPAEVRVKRVMSRSGLTAQQVQERIAAQQNEDRVDDGESVIINDDNVAVLPQVIQLFKEL
jgi:dephospho-CoA kinase